MEKEDLQHIVQLSIKKTHTFNNIMSSILGAKIKSKIIKINIKNNAEIFGWHNMPAK